MLRKDGAGPGAREGHGAGDAVTCRGDIAGQVTLEWTSEESEGEPEHTRESVLEVRWRG